LKKILVLAFVNTSLTCSNGHPNVVTGAFLDRTLASCVARFIAFTVVNTAFSYKYMYTRSNVLNKYYDM